MSDYDEEVDCSCCSGENADVQTEASRQDESCQASCCGQDDLDQGDSQVPEVHQTAPTSDATCPCCLEQNLTMIHMQSLRRRRTQPQSLSESNAEPVDQAPPNELPKLSCCKASCCEVPSLPEARSADLGKLVSSFVRLRRRLRRFFSATQATAPRPCCTPPADTTVPATQDEGAPTGQAEALLIGIEGMDCPACTPRVEAALRRIASVTDIKVDYLSGTASISYDRARTSPTHICTEITQSTGFTCTPRTRRQRGQRELSLKFSATVPSKAVCAQILGVPNAEDIVFVHAGNKSILVMHVDPSLGSLQALHQRFIDSGHPCDPVFVDEHEVEVGAAQKALRIAALRTIVAAVFLIPLLVIIWAPLDVNSVTRDSVAFGLAAAIIIGPASSILVSAFKTVFILRQLDADVLVALSVVSAFVYSVVAFALNVASAGNMDSLDPYFETSSLLLTLVLLGRVVSAFVRWRVIRSFLNLSLHSQTPTSVKVIRETGEIGEVHPAVLESGDQVLMDIGDSAVSDGIIVSHGTSHFDESLITGEGNPVPKDGNGKVLAGSRLLDFSSTSPESEQLLIRLTASVNDSSLADLKYLVSEARSSRPPTQDATNHLASFLLPIILVVALLLLAVWSLIGRFSRGDSPGRSFTTGLDYCIALLASSCPCALMLCTPLVYVAMTRRALSAGSIIKNAAAFGGAHRVTDVVFDKTGTLTEGKPTVADEIFIPNEAPESSVDDGQRLDSNQLRRLLLALITDESHPVSKGVATFLRSSGTNCSNDFPLEDKESVPGHGISAKWGSRIVRAGNLNFSSAGSLNHVQSILPDLHLTDKTFLYFSINASVVALYTLEDTLKPAAFTVVSQLKSAGIRVSLLSGDHDAVAWKVGQNLGLAREDVKGGCTPALKKDVLRSMAWKGDCKQEEGEEEPSEGPHPRFWQWPFRREKKAFVIFVGDGSNDAGGLSQADLGISFQSGTEMANASADVILLDSASSLENVPAIVSLSRSTAVRLMACFSWAILYNILSFILSSGVLVKWRLEPRWAGVGELVSLAPIFLLALL